MLIAGEVVVGVVVLAVMALAGYWHATRAGHAHYGDARDDILDAIDRLGGAATVTDLHAFLGRPGPLYALGAYLDHLRRRRVIAIVGRRAESIGPRARRTRPLYALRRPR